jgi:hypothetical protein
MARGMLVGGELTLVGSQSWYELASEWTEGLEGGLDPLWGAKLENGW